MSLSIIHFSDIHINDSRDLILTRINKLKMACVSSLPSQGNVVLAVSGDIAYSGKKEQYDLAANMLNEIERYIKQEKGSEVHVVCVPGNHDCDFKTGSPVIRAALIDSAKQSDIDNDYYNAVKEVQSEYDCFVEGYGIDASQTLPIFEITVAGQKVRFLLVNTAWMSVLKEKPGRIVMPQKLFPDYESNDCKVVFCMYHHPDSWLNPDYKSGFVDYVRVHADMILVGHEHMRDSYEKIGDSFSVYCSHGKELQDSNGDSSAFTVLNFDEAMQNFDVVDFVWDSDRYIRKNIKTNQYHKNIASVQTVYHPKREIIDAAEDIGIAINHFAKENVKLSDLFVWPDINKCDYHNEKKATKTIRRNVVDELSGNTLNIMIGGSSGGKTAFAKSLFLLEEAKDTCCLLLSGKSFNSSDEAKIKETVEDGFKQQYNAENLEQFNQLQRNKRIVIVDDFDLIKLNRDRRTKVLDYLCGFFGRVTIFMSSSMEMPTLLTSNYVTSSKQLIYYDILPLGNAKRKELISKWYHLNENSLTEDEIAVRIENARNQIDTFLGNGAAFIPAMPVFIIGTLQNGDAIKQSLSGSKYGFLYESLIGSSLAKVSSNYNEAGMYNIDESVLSKLAFDILFSGHTSFTEEQLSRACSEIGEIYILQLSPSDFLSKLIDANIVRFDPSEGAYRFKYPYIFYYFAGRYIAYNLQEPSVNQMIERMSTRLYNETYGNIIIFVCHFAGSNDVIESILLNAYGTLENYEEFDFTKTNPIFEEIKEMVDALIPATIARDSDVEANKQRALVRMDEVGINDGHVNEGEVVIDDEVTEKEKEMAAVSSALKTIEVLGQILQNYPVAVKGEEKLEIITEMHKLGMRSVQAIINTMGYLEKDLVEYIMERAIEKKKNVRREDVAKATRQFINMLVSGMARGMVHQVANALNSEHLLPAAQQTFEADDSISSKLILTDLKMNCINRFTYNEVRSLKNQLDSNKERFASRILDSIIAQYLNYNRCNRELRAKLCGLCGFSEQQAIVTQKNNLLN